MVDKIDKPEAPSPYAIGGTTETKRDKPHEEKNQEDLPTFKKKDTSIFKEKFQGELGVLKTVKVQTNQIDKLLFRRATPHHGVPTAEANLVWKDGRTTEGVSFRIQHWQDFLKIKNLKPGTVIPPSFWNYSGEELEITIVKLGSTSGSWNVKELQRQAEEAKRHNETQKSFWHELKEQLKLFDPDTKKIRPSVAGIYFLGLIAFFLIGLLLIKRF